MTEAFRYLVDAGKQSTTIDDRLTPKASANCFGPAMAGPVGVLRPVRSMMLLTGALTASPNGIPNENTGAAVDARPATVLLGGPGGVTSAGAKTWSQASAGIPGNTERNDWFGLSGGTFNWPSYVPVR